MNDSQDNSDKFFDMDTSSDEFQGMMQVALHTIGGPENMNRIVTGCVPGSRTYMSDSHTMTMVLGQAAIDMHQFQFASKLAQAYMATFADVVDQLSEDERTSIERLFIDSMIGLKPSIMADIEKMCMEAAAAEIKKIGDTAAAEIKKIGDALVPKSVKRFKPDTDQ